MSKLVKMKNKVFKNPTLYRKKVLCETEDEMLLSSPEIKRSQIHPLNSELSKFTQNDPWRIMRIQSEYVQSFDAMSEIANAVCIFGSARTKREDKDFLNAVTLANNLA